jgi:hypothetical protein
MRTPQRLRLAKRRDRQRRVTQTLQTATKAHLLPLCHPRVSQTAPTPLPFRGPRVRRRWPLLWIQSQPSTSPPSRPVPQFRRRLASREPRAATSRRCPRSLHPPVTLAVAVLFVTTKTATGSRTERPSSAPMAAAVATSYHPQRRRLRTSPSAPEPPLLRTLRRRRVLAWEASGVREVHRSRIAAWPRGA